MSAVGWEFSRSLKVDLSTIRLGFQAGIPREIAPMEQGGSAGIFMSSPQHSQSVTPAFLLLIKAVTKVYLGSRQEAYISPLDGEECQSHIERRASWVQSVLLQSSLENTIGHVPPDPFCTCHTASFGGS